MRKIILASRSKARKDLLKQVGLKFSVAGSRIREKRIIRKRCSDLVIKNALLKAQDVARRHKAGIVIGADTVVLVGGKIIGKPKNFKDAVRTLKLLSRKPQWVYTGLAVVDIDKGATFTAYEKTMVYMRALTDARAKSYLKKGSTLDKAGSFDIQGLGAIFVDRIEGCYYNVVGLPLSKLAQIFEKIDIHIFS